MPRGQPPSPDLLRARALANRPLPASGERWRPRCTSVRLPRDTRDLHLLVGEAAALDDHVVVERDRAVAHRHIVVALGGALAAALRIRAGGEQEVAGEATRAGVVALRIGAVERDGVPASLRIEAPAEMRDGVPVHVLRVRAIAV